MTFVPCLKTGRGVTDDIGRLNLHGPPQTVRQTLSQEAMRFEFDIDQVQVSVYKGNITKEQTDAIVNAANSSLAHAGRCNVPHMCASVEAQVACGLLRFYIMA
jgi:hypothetical protein